MLVVAFSRKICQAGHREKRVQLLSNGQLHTLSQYSISQSKYLFFSFFLCGKSTGRIIPERGDPFEQEMDDTDNETIS